MDHVLEAIEKNKDLPADVLQSVSNDGNLGYNALRLMVDCLNTAVRKPKVMGKYEHLKKYITLLNMVVMNKAHLEHMNTEEWSACTFFLTESFNYICDSELTGLHLIRALGEVFQGLSCLIKCYENCVADGLDVILNVCSVAVRQIGFKETTCHLHLMTCARHLIMLGWSSASEVGEKIIRIENIRNSDLAYECFVYACLIPQPWSVLLKQEIRMISSHEVEFIAAPNLGLRWFRPSGDADLTKFVTAIALSRSTTESQETPSKRPKADFSGFKYMAKAFNFENFVEINTEFVLQWLDTCEPSNVDAIFWALVVLGKILSSSVVNKATAITIWNKVTNLLENPGCSSGASFVLSQIVPVLMAPQNIDKVSITKINVLLRQMCMTPHPSLTSGSLLLLTELKQIRILDDEWQSRKNSQLRSWFQSRIDNGSVPLMNHLFDCEYPHTYLQRDEFLDLEAIVELRLTESIVTSYYGDCIPFTELPRYKSFIESHFRPNYSSQTLRDSLVILANLAHTEQDIIPLYKSTTDACTTDDLRALVWFAGLARFFHWHPRYCHEALNLADWSSHDVDSSSVSGALSLLKQPGIILNGIISGHIVESELDALVEDDFNSVVCFLNSYMYERSPWILINLAKIVTKSRFLTSSKARKLTNFLIKICYGHSQFSRLRKVLCGCETLESEDFANIFSGASEQIRFSSLESFRASKRLSVALPLFYDQLSASIYLAITGNISLAQLLAVVSASGQSGILKLQNAAKYIKFNNLEDILKSGAVPLGLNDIKAFHHLSKIVSQYEIFDRAKLILEAFFITDLDRSDETLAGILEQIVKESFFASDEEKSNYLPLWFQFLQAHRTAVPKNLIITYFNNVCASLCSQDLLSLEVLRNIANQYSQKCDTETQLEIFTSLYSVGLKSFALESLRLIEFPGKKFNNLLNLKIECILDVIKDLNTNVNEVSFEFWYLLIDLLTKSCNSLGLENSYKQLKSFNKNEVQLLFVWTNFLKISDTTWSCILSRLCVDKSIDFTIGNRLDIENKSPIEALEIIYKSLPFSQKRLLHPFWQRMAHTSFGSLLTIENIPKDIFGRNNWVLEGNYRPSQIHFVSEDDSELFEVAQDLVHKAIEVLRYEFLGHYVLKEIPQLIQDFVPLLVATAMVSNLDDFKQNLVQCLHSRHEKKTALALEIYQHCLNHNVDLTSSRKDIAIACEWISSITKRDTYVRLGIMMAEISCFENPSLLREKDDLIKMLRSFYCELGKYDDNSFAAAIEKENSEFTLQEIAKTVSPWKELELNMICAEVLSSTNVNIGEELENVGMWNLAQRFQGTVKYYDLEQAWWLQNWESVHFESDNFQIYTNRDFGPVIGAVSGVLSPESALNILLRERSLKLKSIVTLFYSSPDLSLSDEVTRRGYELLCRQKNNYIDLAIHLKSCCDYFRKNNKIQESLEYAVKLECLSKDINVRNDKYLTNRVQGMSKIENCFLQWELGQHSNAISSMKSLLIANDIENLELDKPFLLCTLGTWSQKSRNESNEQILTQYFEEASKQKTFVNSEYIHHSYARFCDVAYHDPGLTSSIKDTERQVENLTSQCKRLQKSLNGEENNLNIKKLLSRTPRLLRSCKKDLLELKERKKTLIYSCIDNYIASLAHGDSFPQDMGRLISLWLEFHKDDGINSLLFEKSTDGSLGNLRISIQKFVPWINQLASRLDTLSHETMFQNLLHKIITEATLKHPFHSIWQLMQIASAEVEPSDEGYGRKIESKNILNEARRKIPKIINSLKELRLNFIHLGKKETKTKNSPITLENTLGRQAKYWHNQLIKTRIPLPTVSIPLRSDCNYEDTPSVAVVESQIILAGGLSRPMIMTFYDTEGKKVKLVLKNSSDDLRQDSLMQQVFDTASTILHQLNHKLNVRTYKVVPLDKQIGVIEFVANSPSLLEVLQPLHSELGGANEWTHKKCREYLSSRREGDRHDRIRAFQIVMEHSTPQMRHYWSRITHNAAEWLEIKTRWSRSTAVMSILGYIIGLGDRHCSNLLVDKATGEVVHIDLGIAFDQGKLLSIPELVPFRLTRDVVDGMGVCGTSGVFQKSAEFTLQAMRDNSDRIMTVLEVLQYDTLYSWRVPSSKLRRVQIEENAVLSETPAIENGQAEHVLQGVRQKLSNTLNCEAVVRELILQARDPVNLALIFPGWTPFY